MEKEKVLNDLDAAALISIISIICLFVFSWLLMSDFSYPLMKLFKLYAWALITYIFLFVGYMSYKDKNFGQAKMFANFVMFFLFILCIFAVYISMEAFALKGKSKSVSSILYENTYRKG